MKLHILHDSEGRIVAASVPERGTRGSPIPRAVKGSEHAEAQLDIPEQHKHLEIQELLTRVTIDPKSKKPTFKA